MSAPALLCAAIEVALNRTLRLEAEAIAACAALQGRLIALHATDLSWTLAIEPIAGGVRVLDAPDGVPDVQVSAPSARLLGAALGLARGRSARAEGLSVEGDVELLTRFNAILARVGFDPEEQAARWIGDAAALRLVGGLREALGWGRRAAGRLSEDVAEYLVEETGDLARRADVEDWMNGVDTLREDLDRLAVRLSRLDGATRS